MSLYEILKLQNEKVIELKEVAQEHNLAMQKNDIETILTVVKRQESLILLLAQQDKKREAVQEQLAKHLGGVEGNPTLSQLLEKSPESKAKSELIRMAEKSKENLKALNELNQLNNVLARRGLIFSQQLRNLIQPRDGNTYQGTGEIKTQDKVISVINRTI
ncbi:flagellar protein FlgN [Desulforamulus aquiferis]|uniref:Flagellar protein FlgN n=1 Tax=Desulforamulus aquiferis TaxID=1397668 RepID=A0AAW7ZHP5_9FIRM|nr:flagellar protein FlgN [Desulforamulus aquiferis]MDO7788340.1 flagellar protein FlgN [Desulforamulus aquiferis]